ncbi:MAG: hypothetical protein ACRENL_08745, partial [Candidatus Dormibacteria bacterium]
DPCLVGTWKSVAVSGSLTVAGAHVDLTGGAGEVLTISASGRVRSDDSGTAALTGTAPDGTAYRLTQTGTATGTITGAAGKLTIELDSPSTVTVTLYRDGVQVQSQHPGAANDSFLCTARTALILTSASGTVVRYAPG